MSGGPPTAGARAPLGVGAMVAATLLWGATFVAIRDTLHVLSPVALVFGRFLAAAIVLVAIALPRLGRLTRGTLVGGALAGACFAGGYLSQAIGLTGTSAGSSAFLTCAGSLFAAFYAWPLLRQRPSGSLLRGLALALAGSALLSIDPARGFRFGTGELWSLGGAAIFSLQIVALARFAPGADPLLLGAVQAVAMVLVLLPFSAGALAPYRALDAATAWRFAYLVVAGSLAAPLLQIVAQRALPAGRVALLFALEPVFALLFAVTVGAEVFPGRWWIGAALILAGVTWTEWDAARRAPAEAAPAAA